jgi:PAS domain S-box-containing protein
MAPKQISFVRRYGLALLSTGAALASAIWLREPLSLLSPFFLFYAAVAISSWHGGLGPGLVAVTIGAAAADYYLLPPYGWRSNAEGMERLALFTLVGILIAALNGALHHAKRRYQAEADAARRSEARARRLAEANLIGVFFSNLAGNVRWANRECLRLLGTSQADLSCDPVNWRDATVPEHRPRDANAARELRESHACTPYERDHLLDNGRRIPVLIGCAVAGDDTDDVVGFVLDLTERKRAESEAKRNQERLRDMAAELMIAEERERRRIATVLHDSIVQMLALAKLKIDAARRAASGGSGIAHRASGNGNGSGAPHLNDEADPRLTEAYELVDRAIVQARTLTADISPPVLYELGLGPAIQWLGDRMCADHRLTFEIEWDRTQMPPLLEETRIVLFQAVRELMVNVVKHARASTCRVRILRREPGPAGTGAITMVVEDDGCGYMPPAAPDYARGGFGLFNIRQRLARLGGSVRIEPREGGGTVVTLAAPLAPAAAGVT